MDTAVARTIVQYQIYEYNHSLKKWLWVTERTEDEQQARDALTEIRRIYPEAKFRLVKIASTVTVLEGPAEASNEQD